MPPQQKPTNAIQTDEITNFGGRLTRYLNGDLNSGMAKFNTSWGYDPFSKPGNLTWLEQPTSILSSTSVLVLAAKPRLENGFQYVYTVGSDGTLNKIQSNKYTIPANANLDAPSVIGQLTASSPTFNYGASLEFFQGTASIAGTYTHMYVGNDVRINVVGMDGSGEAALTGAGYKANVFRSLKEFAGFLNFGNGNTIGQVDATGTLVSSVIGTGQGNLMSALNPPLPVESTVHDLDVSVDGNYLVITSSNIPNESILTSNADVPDAASTDGAIYSWNGSDVTTTAQTQVPSYLISSLHTYLDRFIFWCNDAFGSTLIDQGQKLFTLTGNKPPLPNANASNGSFITWANPEVLSDGSAMVASLYYYGSLDAENQPGLFRLCRISSTQSGGYIYQVPLNILVNNKYSTFSLNRATNNVLGYGKHYISVFDQNSTTNLYKLYRFLVTSTGTGTPQAGVYETQTKLFSKRITIKQIRVYSEPTASGNGFQIDCIGSDGGVITNGTFTYTYAAGTDPTLLQGSLERVDFNPNMKDLFAYGIRITNTGTTNMTIKKVEVDWTPSGK